MRAAKFTVHLHPRVFMRPHCTTFAALAFAAATVAILPSTASAQTRVHGIGRFGLEHGGDKVDLLHDFLLDGRGYRAVF